MRAELRPVRGEMTRDAIRERNEAIKAMLMDYPQYALYNERRLLKLVETLGYYRSSK